MWVYVYLIAGFVGLMASHEGGSEAVVVMGSTREEFGLGQESAALGTLARNPQNLEHWPGIRAEHWPGLGLERIHTIRAEEGGSHDIMKSCMIHALGRTNSDIKLRY